MQFDESGKVVMPALVADIHVFTEFRKEGVDGRDKPGHDGNWCLC